MGKFRDAYGFPSFDKGRVMLPKQLRTLGGYSPGVFWDLSIDDIHYANEALKALGFGQEAIFRDGGFDSYTVPPTWNIEKNEKNDDEEYRFTVQQKGGLVVVEGHRAPPYGLLRIHVPVDKTYEELSDIAAAPNQILIPKYYGKEWTVKGVEYIPKTSRKSLETGYYSSLDFKNIAPREQKNLNTKILSEFYRVTLPEDAQIGFERRSIYPSTQYVRPGRDKTISSLVATFELDGRETTLVAQFWPGWYFGGKRRNARMRIV